MPASSPSAAVEWIARRERAVVLVGLGVATALAWAWLLAGGGMDMGGGRTGVPMGMPSMAGRHGGSEVWGETAVVFAMWTVMMIAMMLPSAAPAILLVAALSRARASTTTFPPVTAFAAGYMLVWTAFSAVATIAHLTLRQAALVSPTLRTTSGVLAALLLIAAGVYQFTPLKTACLRHCRSPIQFLTRYWRRGAVGALRLGVLHGGYCVGCCWVLMGLLFVGGVMNLWWIAAMTAFILVEKIAFLGASGGRMAGGAGLVVAGAVVLALR
jgi:predicted metal-binding membrane protein